MHDMHTDAAASQQPGGVTAGIGGLLTSVEALGRKTKDLGNSMDDWKGSVGGYTKKLVRTIKALQEQSKRIDVESIGVQAFLQTPGPRGGTGPVGFVGTMGADGAMGSPGLMGHIGEEGLTGAAGREGVEGRMGGTGQGV